MRDEDKSKKELTGELSALRQKLAGYKEAEERRSTALSIIRNAFSEIENLSSFAEVGIWTWESWSGKAVFFGSPTKSDFPFWENMEKHYAGQWDEIVHPQDLDTVMKKVDSWRRGTKDSGPFAFRPKDGIDPEKWIFAACWRTANVSNTERVVAQGIYWDATSWIQTQRSLMVLGEDELSRAVEFGLYAMTRPLFRLGRLLIEVVDERETLDNKLLFHSLLTDIWEVPIFVKDAEQKYSFANDALAMIFGIPASEFIGKTDAQLFGEESGLIRYLRT